MFRQPSCSFGVLANQEKEDTTMATQSTPVPATEGQIKHAIRLVTDATDKALHELALDKDAMQRFVELGVVGIMPHVLTLLRGLALMDEFADEEVESEYGYLSGYKQANAATDQFAAIKSIFPQAESYDMALAAKDAPVGSEGNFLILPWQKVAPTYREAVEIVLAKLKETRNGRFQNSRNGQLGPSYLREGDKKIKAMKKIAVEQSGHDVLVVSTQLGIRHRGRSVRRALAVMSGNEIGLGAYEIGFILLTHQNRLQHFDGLWIDAAGDEFAPDADGDFCRAPCFDFDGGGLGFDAYDVDNPHEYCGSASAFVVVVPSE